MKEDQEQDCDYDYDYERLLKDVANHTFGRQKGYAHENEGLKQRMA
jgi:hypothetical protein